MASSERARRQHLQLSSGLTQATSRLQTPSSSTSATVNDKRAAANHLRTPGIGLKTPVLAPKRASNNTTSISGSSRSISSASVSSKEGSSSSLLKRISDVVKRAQPHTIVQAYDKIQRALYIDAQLIVNGEAIAADVPVASSLQSGWKNRDGAKIDHSSVSAGFFDPHRGRFHYALGFRYSQSLDPALSLSTITDIAVSVKSTSRGCVLTPNLEGVPASRSNLQAGRRVVAPAKPKLSVKSWRLVTETPTRVGISLYELPVSAAPGGSGSSSILALAWVAKLEVVAIFAHLHVCEVLSAILTMTPPRPSIVSPLQVQHSLRGDDPESLRGFTMAITIRTSDHVIWEREWFQVDLPQPARKPSCGCNERVVSVSLLDETGAFRDRTRFASNALVMNVAIDAIAISLESVVLVDFCVWEESACAPIWAITRAARALLASTTTSATLEGDFTLTSSGKVHETLEAKLVDHGNLVTLHFVRSYNADTERIVIKQVEVAMNVAFLNAALGTSY